MPHRLAPGPPLAAGVSREALQRILTHLPGDVLLQCREQLAAVRGGERVAVAPLSGAVLLIDVAGFSALASALLGSDAINAAERLNSILSDYFSCLVETLHSRGCDALTFIGDAVLAFVPAAAGPGADSKDGGGGSGDRCPDPDPRAQQLAACAALAAHAALDVRAMRFEREGRLLTAHTGIGLGEMRVYLMRGGDREADREADCDGGGGGGGGGGGALHAVFAGPAVEEACRAQRASAGDEVLLGPAAAAALGPRLPSEPHGPPSGSLRRLVPPSRLPAPRQPSSFGSGSFLPPPCACAASRPAGLAAALGPFEAELAALAPAGLAGDRAVLAGDIRNVFCLFASFPELDLLDPPTPTGPGPGPLPPAAHAERFGQCVRALHGVASEYGGCVNKVMLCARSLYPAS
eukprot:tig00000955_g5801.t1